MRKRTSDYYSSDTEQMVPTEDNGIKTNLSDEYRDIFIMRPLVKDNADDSFKEAIRLYDTGNEEVQQLLLRECSLIYECRMCRNMFRSLKQFIGHKREFCLSAVCGNVDKTEGDKYNGFSNGNVNVTKQNCNDNKNDGAVSVLPTTDEAVKQTRTLCESNELIDEKIPGIHQKTLMEQNDDEKIKNILACPQENCMLNFSTTKDLELHFSQDHTKTIVFPTFSEQKTEQKTQIMPENTMQTRAKRMMSNNIHRCEHCGKTFERLEPLSTHLMHCPVKHNILSQTLAAGSIETSATKRIKLQASTESLPEKEPATEICNGVVVDEPEKKVTAQALVTADTNLQPNAIVKQEYVAQESSTSNNTNILIKKRKLKNRRVLGPKMTADSCAVQIKQEICSAKIKTEYSAGSDGSDVEPKKLLSTCTYCGKSFERRAALSTHLQHCPVKYSVLEKSTIYGMTTSTKRLKLHSTAEKSPKDTRQENGASSIAEDPDTELLNEMFANLGRQDFGVGLQTVTIEQDDSTVSGTDEAKEEDFAQMDNFQLSTPTEEFAENLPANESSTNVELSTSASAIESSPDANEEDTDKKATRRVRLAPVEKRLLCRCKICYKQFNALSNLRRHISMFHYRAQRFGCTLCEYRAFRRYDIVNHLGNTHGMQGDPEAMSIEFVSEHEVNYSREDVEGDIVVLDESKTNLSTLNELNEDIENNIETRQNLKRLKRNKSTTPVSSELAATMGKVTRTKIKRSQSQQETCVAGSSGGVKTPARRPIRNRIKPENKDFVYDLSSLLKNESATDAPDDTTTRNLRRRNNMQGTATEIATQCLEPLLGPVSTWAAIRGAAQRLAAAIVSSGGATSATQPELPAERPQMRQRLISAQRADNHSVAVIEASDLEAARLQSTLLEDTFLEKVTKASPTNFKIKPSLTLHTSTLNWLLEKVDSSLHQHANGKAPSPNASLKCSDENDINKLQVSPPPSIPRTNAPPPTPRKRLSMLDRLRDDTFKYRDSLLRSALEN